MILLQDLFCNKKILNIIFDIPTIFGITQNIPC